MKKKLMVGVLAAALAVGMVMAFTACGANGSPESVVRAALEAEYTYDIDTMLDITYFEDEADRAEEKELAEKELEEMGEFEISIKITKFEFKEEETTDDELKAAQEKYAGIDIEEICNFSFVFSAEFSMTVTVEGVEETIEDSVTDENVDGTVYKIGGKWYVAIETADDGASA